MDVSRATNYLRTRTKKQTSIRDERWTGSQSSRACTAKSVTSLLLFYTFMLVPVPHPSESLRPRQKRELDLHRLFSVNHLVSLTNAIPHHCGTAYMKWARQASASFHLCTFCRSFIANPFLLHCPEADF